MCVRVCVCRYVCEGVYVCGCVCVCEGGHCGARPGLYGWHTARCGSGEIDGCNQAACVWLSGCAHGPDSLSRSTGLPTAVTCPQSDPPSHLLLSPGLSQIHHPNYCCHPASVRSTSPTTTVTCPQSDPPACLLLLPGLSQIHQPTYCCHLASVRSTSPTTTVTRLSQIH